MNNTIHWLEPTPHIRQVKGKSRTEMRYPVTCACGNTRLLSKSDARKAERKNSPCFYCSQIAKGKKGYQATVKKHGRFSAMEKVQAYRLAHPSNLEVRVIDILNQLGVRYEREVWLESARAVYLIDFVVKGLFAIEVNGAWAHSHHQERDQRKHNEIRAAGYRLLIINESDMDTALPLIATFINVSVHTQVTQ